MSCELCGSCSYSVPYACGNNWVKCLSCGYKNHEDEFPKTVGTPGVDPDVYADTRGYCNSCYSRDKFCVLCDDNRCDSGNVCKSCTYKYSFDADVYCSVCHDDMEYCSQDIALYKGGDYPKALCKDCYQK